MKKNQNLMKTKTVNCPRGMEVKSCGDCPLYMDSCRGNEAQWELEELEEINNGPFIAG